MLGRKKIPKTCVWYNIGMRTNCWIPSCTREGLVTTGESFANCPDVGEPCPLCGRPVNPSNAYHPRTVLSIAKKQYNLKI